MDNLIILHGINWDGADDLPATYLFAYDTDEVDEPIEAAIAQASEDNGCCIISVDTVISADAVDMQHGYIV